MTATVYTPYKHQEPAIEKATQALIDRGNTLVVIPTGGGKTIVMSFITDNMLMNFKGMKVLFLVHREEINEQNYKKFIKVTGRHAGLFTSDIKLLIGDVVFGMVQTVYRHLEKLPKFDMIVIDEGHHACADTYDTIINHLKRKNKNLKILLMTATPNRGDKQGLIKYTDNVAHQIFIKDLIRTGFLVKPIPISITLNTLEKRHHLAKEENYDVVNNILYDKMKDYDVFKKKTIIFCKNFKQSDSVMDFLDNMGIRNTVVNSKLGKYERYENLKEFEEGDTNVIVNVDVLTEGYDYPPASCIIILRAVGNKSLYMQMVGRGLRTVSHLEYPGVFKKDCLLLDFAGNLEIYTNLEQEVDLIGVEKKEKSMLSLLEEKAIREKENSYVEESSLFSEEKKNLFKKYNIFWEFFDTDIGLIRGCCGYRSTLFIIDNKILYQADKKNGDKFILVKDKINLDKLINDCMIGEVDNKKRINMMMNKAQINILFGSYNISSCSNYRASVMINFEVNKKRLMSLINE